MSERERIGKLFGLAAESPLLEQALTHPSYANEHRALNDNQRLEFLGDAVLQLCSSELLCSNFPSADEGLLTRMRAQLVNTGALAGFARHHQLSTAILVGRGAEANGLRDSNNVLADCVEALIAATFLELGYEAARAACRLVVNPGLQKFEQGPSLDPKTDLQERVQATSQAVPRYAVLESWGPAHDRWFRVAVSIDDREIAQGVGRSKRTAEREAARAALTQAARLNPPSPSSDSADPALEQPTMSAEASAAARMGFQSSPIEPTDEGESK